MAFGLSIKKLREEAGISVEKLTQKIGVKADRWRKWEEKDFDPRDEDQEKIEEFFGRSLTEINKLSSIKEFLKVPKPENSKKDPGKQPSPMELLAGLTEGFKAIAETMRSIESKMAQESTQAKIAEKVKEIEDRTGSMQSNLTEILLDVQSISSRQKGAAETVLHALEELTRKDPGELVKKADKRIRQIEKDAYRRDNEPVQNS